MSRGNLQSMVGAQVCGSNPPAYHAIWNVSVFDFSISVYLCSYLMTSDGKQRQSKPRI